MSGDSDAGFVLPKANTSEAAPLRDTRK